MNRFIVTCAVACFLIVISIVLLVSVNAPWVSLLLFFSGLFVSFYALIIFEDNQKAQGLY